MAATQRANRKWERQDQTRLLSAVQEISRSENLRYLIRTLLGSSGILSIIPSDNALAMARAAGRHELGMELLTTLNQMNPRLYPQMLLEEHNEQMERLSSQADYGNADRGDADSADPNDAAESSSDY